MNAWLTSAYERLGWLWIPAFFVVLGTLAELFLALALLLEVEYLQASGKDFWKLIAIGTPVFLGALAITALLSLDLLVPPARWLRAGKPPEVVPEIWRSSIRVGHVVVARGVMAYSVIAVPFHLIVSPHVLGSGTDIALPLILFGWCTTATAWIVLTPLADLLFRPLVRDLASRLPADLGEPPRGWRLRTKALFTVVVAAFYGAFAAGALVFGVSSPEARLYVAMGAAAIVAVAFAIPVAAIATGSILDPVEDLIDATKRVSRGEFSESVPILTDDELADVARSFNVMQRGLIEREALRDENVGLVDELEASRARIVASSAEARRKVERDLHDGAQQHLVLLKLKLGMVERELRKDPEAAARMAGTALEDLDRALAELRDLAHGIYPQVLTSDGLPAALQQAADQAAIPTTLSANGTGRYRPELEAAVYFCCLEALQNAAKYAGEGATATVTLSDQNGELRFEVADDGAGFDADAAAESSGLQGMSDRIGALRGELRIDSARGQGTRVAGSVPLES